jgi:hypothetical protein
LKSGFCKIEVHGALKRGLVTSGASGKVLASATGDLFKEHHILKFAINLTGEQTSMHDG